MEQKEQSIYELFFEVQPKPVQRQAYFESFFVNFDAILTPVALCEAPLFKESITGDLI